MARVKTLAADVKATYTDGARRLVSANSYYLGLPNRLWRLPIPLMRLVDWRAASEKGWSEEDWDLVEGRLVLKPALAAPPKRSQLLQPGAHPLLTYPLAAAGQAGKAISSLLGQTKTFAVLFSFVGSNWWQLGMRGDLPSFLCPPECRGQLDYVAFDYYYGTELLHNKARRHVQGAVRNQDRARHRSGSEAPPERRWAVVAGAFVNPQAQAALERLAAPGRLGVKHDRPYR